MTISSGWVYQITFPSGKFYIGSTVVSPSVRKSTHLWELKAHRHCNQYLQRLWNKYGSFEFNVLEECTREDALIREQDWLDREWGDPLLVNLCRIAGRQSSQRTEEWRRNISRSLMGRPGSLKGIPRTEEVKTKLSAINKGKPNPNKGKPNGRKGEVSPKKGKPGKPHTEETKKKMSEAHKGKPYPQGRKSSTEEGKLKRAEAMRIDWEKRRSRGWKHPAQTEESNLKRSKAMKAYWAKRKLK